MRTVLFLASGVVLTSLGLRRARAGPTYEVLERMRDSLEVRRYESQLVAETKIDAGATWAVCRTACRRLFVYLSAVQRHPTGLLEENSGNDGCRTLRAFLPRDLALDGIPEPEDVQVSLRVLPEQTVVARRFSGSRHPQDLDREKQALMSALAATHWWPRAEPIVYLYDPPWTPPVLRRNEVAVRASLAPPDTRSGQSRS